MCSKTRCPRQRRDGKCHSPQSQNICNRGPAGRTLATRMAIRPAPRARRQLEREGNCVRADGGAQGASRKEQTRRRTRGPLKGDLLVRRAGGDNGDPRNAWGGPWRGQGTTLLRSRTDRGEVSNSRHRGRSRRQCQRTGDARTRVQRVCASIRGLLDHRMQRMRYAETNGVGR